MSIRHTHIYVGLCGNMKFSIHLPSEGTSLANLIWPCLAILSFLINSPVRWCASHLQGQYLPSSLNKIPLFHMHISVSEFVILLYCRASGYSTLHPCKEYKNIQFLATSPIIIQSLQYNIHQNIIKISIVLNLQLC